MHDHPFEILLEPFSRSGLPFKIFFSRLAVITIRSKIFTSHSAVQDHSFEILLEPFNCSGLLFEIFFSRSAVITIRSKFFAVLPSCQSVRNKLSAVQCHPFQTALWAVSYLFDSCAFPPFNRKPLVYVFAWEVTNGLKVLTLLILFPSKKKGLKKVHRF